uniref:Uncharacterized protein n=1 Tax=Globodera rostochiensis TaxID=31243 RepID=A0A914HSP4_GLORO
MALISDRLDVLVDVHDSLCFLVVTTGFSPGLHKWRPADPGERQRRQQQQQHWLCQRWHQCAHTIILPAIVDVPRPSLNIGRLRPRCVQNIALLLTTAQQIIGSLCQRGGGGAFMSKNVRSLQIQRHHSSINQQKWEPLYLLYSKELLICVHATEKQQQQMEKILICADIWYEVFAFLCLFELGLKMALISDRLDVLVDVHFKSREWSLGLLRICRADDGNGAQIVNARSDEWLPIPQEPPPGKAIGFKHIEISYVDQSVIQFLQRIRRLFDSSEATVCITTLENQGRSWEIIRQKIWPLVNDNICGFLLYFPYQFDRLRRILPAILRNCAKLRSINTLEIFAEFPAEDNAEASSGQAVAKWLLTPRGDGLPKMLHCWCYSGGMEALKMAFVNASEPTNFIISLPLPFYSNESFISLLISVAGFEPFELTNNLTGEQLTLRRSNQGFDIGDGSSSSARALPSSQDILFPPISYVLAKNGCPELLDQLNNCLKYQRVKAIEHIGEMLSDLGLDHITRAFKQCVAEKKICRCCGKQIGHIDELCYCPSSAGRCHCTNKCNNRKIKALTSGR